MRLRTLLASLLPVWCTALLVKDSDTDASAALMSMTAESKLMARVQSEAAMMVEAQQLLRQFDMRRADTDEKAWAIAADASASLGTKMWGALKEKLLTYYTREACDKHVSYSWPQIAFWTTQVMDRVQAVKDGRLAADYDVKSFAWKAAFLSCNRFYDPRSTSEGTQKYFQRIPVNSLNDSKINEGFPQLSVINYPVSRSCALFALNSMCEVGWWVKHLKGNKDYGGEKCWDKVPVKKAQFRIYYHPEYSQCQEHNFNQTVLRSICQKGGHPSAAEGSKVPEGFEEELASCKRYVPWEKNEVGNYQMLKMRDVGLQGASWYG